MNRANLLIILTALLILTVTFLTILLAKGYLPDPATRTFKPTGILVSTSDPDGARVYIDDKLTTATNNTINLEPGVYEIKIEKDGFSPWTKKVEIKKEEVIKTNAFLFPTAPDLRPLTLTGALNPAVSQDLRKIVYGVASASAEKNGIWILDLDSGRPIIGGVSPRQFYRDLVKDETLEAKYSWGPDSDQIIVSLEKTTPKPGTATTSAQYLVSDTSKFNPQLGNPLTPVQKTDLLRTWAALEEEKYQLNLSKLDPIVSQYISAVSSSFKLAPDETKVLYTASSSATLPKIRPQYLPGINSTPESRTVEKGSTYVYDILEDRNYLADKLTPAETRIEWFPSSRHLIISTPTDISVMEYDGSNKAVLYTGPFAKDVIVPWPNWSKLVILTSLNATIGRQNLYSINLR